MYKMDEVLLALSTSPLYNSLEQNSNYDAFKYSMERSYGALSKQKVEVPLSNAYPNTISSVELPRYGLVHNIYLRLAFKIESEIQFDYTGWFCELIQRATLSSHSREIETITSSQILQYVLESSTNDNNSMFKRFTLFENTDTLTAGRYIIGYLPLPFSFFGGSKSYKSSKDLSFLEKLTIRLEWNDFNGSMRSASTNTNGEMNLVVNNELITADGTAPQLNDGEYQSIYRSCLMMNFINIPNEARRMLQRDTYRIKNGKPLSLMMSNTVQEIDFREDTDVATADLHKPRTLKIDLTNKQVIYQTRITLKNGNVKTPIRTIRLWMSGRIVREWNDTSEIEFENALEHRYGGASARMNDNGVRSDNIYVINHNIDKDPLTKCSGALSLKGIANPQIEVVFVPTATGHHICSIEHSYYQLCSINGADGSCLISASL